MGNPQRTLELYETTLPTLPSVYRRDRGVALSWCAIANLAADQPVQAACIAREALQIAHMATPHELAAMRRAIALSAFGLTTEAHQQRTPGAASRVIRDRRMGWWESF